jgi:outer membrane protein TolC
MRFRKTFIFAISIINMFIMPVLQARPEEDKAVSIGALVDEGLKNNPGIRAAYNEWQAALYKAEQVRSLPDPAASFSYFGENVETRVGPQQRKYGASLKIPFPGKLNLKGDAQASHAEMLKEKYEAAKRELIKKIKFTYYDIFWIDKAVQINEEEKLVLENLEKVARRKFESDLAPQHDAIKAQVELIRIIDKLLLLKRTRNSLAAKMNSLLNRPEGRQFAAVRDVEPEPFKYGLQELHKISRRSRQELLAAKLDIERKQYEESLARLDYLPDFTLGFDYIEVGGGSTARADDGQDAWMGRISINLPIWFDKLESQLIEKEAALQASKKNYENIENSVAYEVEDLYFKITTYMDIVSLYKTALIPQTEQSFEAARTGYETGKVDFLNWLDSERILLQTRVAYYKAIVDYQKSIAYLERVAGRDL